MNQKQRNKSELLLRELCESNNVNDLSFQWPKESIPSALPIGDAEGATRDLNRLLDIVGVLKPANESKQALSYKDIIRLVEVLEIFPSAVTHTVKERLAEIFNDNNLITQPKPIIPPINQTYQQDHIFKSSKYTDLLERFNKEQQTRQTEQTEQTEKSD